MYLANELVGSGKNIVCVDKDERKVKKVLDICNYAFVTEDLSVQALEELDFKDCDVIVICIGEQMDTDIFATLNVHSSNAGKVI